ncbi:MAG: S-methyl-5-thioribose-1-phosphate isomerase [Firmicutes bacterium]|nr:S-methyl-5-thioribose-1-phosphate isomerase [Bacillota bacterium]
MPKVASLVWKNDHLELIDQTKLPLSFEVVQCTTYKEVADAIRTMKVRGAPAIGATAAFGVALGALELRAVPWAEFLSGMDKVFAELAATRPTAVNLFWALERMGKVVEDGKGIAPVNAVVDALVDEAELIAQEDIDTCHRIGEVGASVISSGAGVLTICNAGALATVDYGTALGVIRAAHSQGKDFHVYTPETRPFLQGSRLTAWELLEEGIPTTLITDSMAGCLMQAGKVQVVIVGADRIAANGDTANKIGTYAFSVLAKYHGIPFYVAAPLSTVDRGIASGRQIPIEERPAGEVTHICGHQIAPTGINVYNPAFDVTPAGLISGIITEAGMIVPPFGLHLEQAFASK